MSQSARLWSLEFGIWRLASWSPLLWPPCLRKAGRDRERVFVIQLLQHVIRQRHSVELPEGVVIAVIVEVLVIGFEHAPVVRILALLVGILAEQHAILVLDEELARGAR